MKKIKKFSTILASFLAVAICSFCVAGNVFAGSFSVSPMSENVALAPGDTYYGSFMVYNSPDSGGDFTFESKITPFSEKDETGNVQLEAYKNYSLMTDWITILNGEGTIAPGEKQIVNYTINVPNDAPAGGQYASIIVRSATSDSVDGTINIQQIFQIGYLIYADIAGETTHSGEIESLDVPSFLLSGNISGTATIRNDSNVHEAGEIVMQVFPLFSNEEVFTNEEDPTTTLVMPEATRMKTVAWDNTPDVGIYNVKFTAKFQGITQTVEKVVIKCPIWLLFIIIFAVIFLIFWLVMKSKNRKKSKR